ncbi:DNA primase [Dissulfurirhabdus thermomarina]|uniref:DNA primase n=1 Tax=Dissulfurirhabdus thermomarina TaxID=1765737 RepID=A0A6N9TKS1_DISTH|nr:DNA primase [Dissulfurirhabdus thermomarina]NDY41845.1 DNA primase [Dissulfurirhabdus thermomarina]NMX22993.1 DNA primase [Dissulfurirhabdus thermomarina]
MIPEEVIRSVREAARIREIVGEYLPLRRAGRSWMGVCPFHADTDPSFSVNEDRQTFHCFGCGEGGDVFKFLMKVEGLTFVEAVKALAARYGIPVPERPLSPRQQAVKDQREQLAAANELAAEVYREALEKAPEAAEARAYLDRRGLAPEIRRRFRLGWAPDRWDFLARRLEAAGVPAATGMAAGLLAERRSGSGCYDRFRGRIVFPILDLSGRVVALGGRLIRDGQPKYLNSPETPLYRKGEVLYGLHQNREAVRRAGRGFVVEGYMDLLALVQAGIEAVAATLGTALTAEHAGLLHRYAREWILVFDADPAGLKAALRSIPLLLREDLNVRVLCLPEGDDPDSFVRREGPKAWWALAEAAPAWIDFALDQGRRLHGDTPEGTARAVDDLVPLLEAVRDPVRQSLHVAHVCRRTGLREDSLVQRLRMERRGAPRERRAAAHGGGAVQATAQKSLVGFLLCHPEHVPAFAGEGLENWLDDPDHRELWNGLVHLMEAGGPLDLATFLLRLEGLPELKALAARLAKETPACDDIEATVHRLLTYCREQRKKALRRELLDRIRSDPAGDPARILEQIQALR